MPSLKESRNKFLLLLPFGAKAYKTIIGKKSEYFPKIRKLASLKQSGFLDGKQSDFLNEIVLMRNRSLQICQTRIITIHSID
ncbi:hypothetical protein DDZ16_09165 [Marinilabilia rubra]|uniref:Uncharacterized protein n=1 Tax=Marinilabilia rubra TaxID=2162893 RepID=A0A2U2B992_9BACT|nr:hypothetical protein DDZ16_09165 [Marinilabilia rubra]